MKTQERRKANAEYDRDRAFKELRPKVPRQVWRKKVELSGSNDVEPITSLINNRSPSPEADIDPQGTSQLCLRPQEAIFKKPIEHRHMKPLYLKGFINGKPIAKMLIDGGAAVNLMSYSTYLMLWKSKEDLVRTNTILSGFHGKSMKTKGVFTAELTVGSKTLPTSFFVVDGKSSYTVLLGRKWIHANCCIPSTMHQMLLQWDGDRVETIQADATT